MRQIAALCYGNPKMAARRSHVPQLLCGCGCGMNFAQRAPGGMNSAQRAPDGMNFAQRAPDGMNFAQRAPDGMNSALRAPDGMNFAQRAPDGMNFALRAPDGMNFAQRAPDGMNFAQRAPVGDGLACVCLLLAARFAMSLLFRVVIASGAATKRFHALNANFCGRAANRRIRLLRPVLLQCAGAGYIWPPGQSGRERRF